MQLATREVADGGATTVTRKKAHVVKHRIGNYPLGEAHYKAHLTDHEVELMRELHEEHPVGHPQHLGYRRLAKMFGVSKTTVRHICVYRERGRGTSRK